MEIESLKQVLIRRDGLTSSEAEENIREAKEDLLQRLEDGEFVDDADFMKEWFSLEPDYIMDVLF